MALNIATSQYQAKAFYQKKIIIIILLCIEMLLSTMQRQLLVEGRKSKVLTWLHFVSQNLPLNMTI